MTMGPHRLLAMQFIGERRTEINAELAALVKMEGALATLSTGDDISAIVAITEIETKAQRRAIVMFGIGIREPLQP